MIEKLIKQPKQLFLIDGMGAVVSVIFLGGVMVYFNPYFGMPIPVLLVLAVLAIVLASFSLAHYLKPPNFWKSSMFIIALTNTFYCVLSGILMIVYFSALTPLGIIYFVLEKVIVITIAATEFYAYLTQYKSIN